VIAGTPSPGQTPVDPDEMAGLKPRHIVTQAQLNEFEQLNIVKGQRWAFRHKGEVLQESYVRELHRRMFGDTWQWAGQFRKSDKSIGVAWNQVGIRLHQLLANTVQQIEHAAFPADQLAVRFHHQLVWIHPFVNGNGRHSRMMADVLITRLGGTRFSWGAHADLLTAGSARADYIAALRAADQGSFDALISFARS